MPVLMLIRRNYCGQVRSTASSRWAARACHYRLTQTLSQRPITFACSALPSLLILAWTNMFPAYVHHVSSGYANFDEFDDHWAMSPWRHLSTLLWQLESTTVTWYSPAHRGLWPTNYNRCWTPPYVSSAARASTTVDCHRFYMTTCTGSMWQIGSSTSLALQSTDVSTTKRRSMW